MLSHPAFISKRLVGLTYDEEPRIWQNNDEVRDRVGTKWRMLLRLFHYIFARDEGPYPELVDEEEGLVFPNKRNTSNRKRDPKAKHKGVIYVEFTIYLDWITKVSKFA